MKRILRQEFETELGHIIRGLRRYALFGSFARGDYYFRP